MSLLLLLLLVIFALPLPVGAEEAAPPEMVPQLGQSDLINRCALSADGMRFATKDAGGNLAVWDMRTGLIVLRAQALSYGSKLELSPDGGMLLLKSSNGELAELWSLRTGKRMPAFRRPPDEYCFSFSPDARHVWSWGYEKKPTPGLGDDEWFFLPESPARASVLRLIDPTTNTVERTIGGLTGRIIAISPDDAQAVTFVFAPPPGKMPADYQEGMEYRGKGATTFILWDLATGKEVRRFGPIPGFVNAVWSAMPAVARFSPDGALFAVQPCVLANRKGGALRLEVWETATGRLVRSCTRDLPPQAGVSDFAFAEGKARLLVVTADSLVSWELTGTGPPRELPLALPAGYNALPSAVQAMSPEGRFCVLANGGTDPLWVCDTRDGQVVDSKRPVLSMPPLRALLPDRAGRQLIAVYDGNALPVWDLTQGRVLRMLTLPAGYYATAAVRSGDGRWLLVGAQPSRPRNMMINLRDGLYASTKGILCLFDIASGALAGRWTAHGGALLRAAAFSPDDRRAVTAGDDRQLIVWDTRSWQPLASYPLVAGMSPNSLAFSPDGTLLAISGMVPHTEAAPRSYLTMLDMTAAPLRPRVSMIQEAVRPVAQVVFSPNGQTLAELRKLPSSNRPIGKGESDLVLLRAADGQELWRQESYDLGFGWLYFDAAPLVAFSPDGASLAVGGRAVYLNLRDARTGALQKMINAEGLYNLRAMACWGAGETLRLATANTDGTIRIWRYADLLTKKQPTPLAILLAGEGGRWIATTPGGYYDCALEAANGLVWRMPDGNILPFDAFAATYQRPDILRKSLAGDDISQIPPIDAAQAPPVLTFTAPRYGAEIKPGTTPPIGLSVKGSAPIARIEVTINGQPLPPKYADALVFNNPTQAQVTLSLPLPLPQNTPRIRLRAVAYDTHSLKSAPAELALFRPGAQALPGNLYLLAVGINRYPKLPKAAQLTFAVPDATAFAQALRTQYGNKPYAGVSVALLTDDKASLSTLKLALRQVKDISTENDTVLIYISGHGLQDAAGDYYFPTYEADLKDLPGTALSWQDFQGALREVRAKQLLVLADTCQSGGLLGANQASTDLLAVKLNRQAHRMVFTASQGDESSLENAEWGHGAFTLALLEALGGKADENTDGWLSYQELATFVRARVVELTKGRQHPRFPFLDQFDPDAILARVVSAAGK